MNEQRKRKEKGKMTSKEREKKKTKREKSNVLMTSKCMMPIDKITRQISRDSNDCRFPDFSSDQ